MRELLKLRIKQILTGIDSYETEGGWWETSLGVEFGKKRLEELFTLIDNEVKE